MKSHVQNVPFQEPPIWPDIKPVPANLDLGGLIFDEHNREQLINPPRRKSHEELLGKMTRFGRFKNWYSRLYSYEQFGFCAVTFICLMVVTVFIYTLVWVALRK